MPQKEGQLAKRLSRRMVDWDEAVEDPRSRRGRRHRHRGLLNLLVLALASGAHTLRHVEDVAEDMGAVARRLFGVAKKVSDTALYLVLQRQKVEGFRETLLAQVKHLWRAKRLENDRFPLGVVALDGKSVWASSRKGIEGAKETVNGNVTVSSLAMMNAVLVSSSSTPCLDLQLMAGKEGEPPAFRDMVKRLAAGCSHLFQVVTGDAGLLCRESAALVQSVGKDYVLGLKGNQPTLLGLAEAAFELDPGNIAANHVDAPDSTAKRITRTLHTRVVRDVGDFDLAGAQEVWRVTTLTEEAGLPPKEEVRYLVSSLKPKALKGAEKLLLVRLHWAIENNRHWTLDVAFLEDDHQPCQTSMAAIEVTCWLRALAFNLVANLRARGPRKDRKPLSWRRTMDKLNQLLLTRFREELTTFFA